MRWGFEILTEHSDFGETLIPKKATLPFVSGIHPSNDTVTGTCNDDGSRCEYNELEDKAPPPTQLDVQVMGEQEPLSVISNVTAIAPMAPLTPKLECGLTFTIADPPINVDHPPVPDFCEFIIPCKATNETTGIEHIVTICNNRNIFLDARDDPRLFGYPSPGKEYILSTYNTVTVIMDVKNRNDNLMSTLKGWAEFNAWNDDDVKCDGQLCTWPGVVKNLTVYDPQWNEAKLFTVDPPTW